MPNPSFEIGLTQKKHVSLLYHFASLSYLQGLQDRLRSLMQFIDPTLDNAKLQGRDALLTNSRWGTRDTSENWANNGGPFLADFELSVAKQIAQRAFEVYSFTDAYNCGRGLSEYSLNWMTPEEEDEFQSRFDDLYLYAHNIDRTLKKFNVAGGWNDFGLTLCLAEHPEALSDATALRLRGDITAHSGTTPPRTGVYLPLDDPHGTPQFCWTGNPPGKLKKCSTFNDLGLEVLASVGRQALWLDEYRMNQFVQSHLQDPRLVADPYFKESIKKPKLAASLVAGQAFTSRPCDWIYVEQLHGQPIDFSEDSSS
ncbi:hypothetical protein RB25_08135 [Herbaspirillum rubrisubalbicans]|uniref:Uncharacterized protein n=1 Tax=Herbaspirillum rubrisubalbicans TaxID=80842 RepID=A0ABX9C5T9_9BURK|nr:hypothetical protein [Herbaspirillum rubrisubalbicans]RAM65868.1 hypothetical protein RB24_05045 [Herbaspirillum rubrisubalbicans]RAN49218.1 hypothetical protein RB25_08135 [Herbaspirillum rubrisubalbicans]